MTLTQYMDVIAERLGISGLPDRKLTTYLEAFAANQGVDVASLRDKLTTTYLAAILKARGVQSVSDNLVTTHLKALAETYGATNLPDRLVSTYLEAIIEGIASIPKEYVAVPYIESTGTQYIDTGFKPNNNTRTIMDVEASASTAVSKSCAFFSARDLTADARKFYAAMDASSGTYNIYWQYGDTYDQFWEMADVNAFARRRIIDGNGASATIDGVTKTYATKTFQVPYNLYLLGSNESGTANHFISAKLYSCKIYDNGELIRDFVPCCRKSDGEVGLYDMVTKAFFGNAGTGEFVCEKPFAVEYEAVEYIQSTGNQYIDTGVVIEDLTSHYKLEMDLTVEGAGGESVSASNVNGYMGINGALMLTLTKNNGLGISSSAGVPWVKGKRYSAVIERRTDAMRAATIDGTYFESSKQGNVYLDRPFGIYALSPFDGGFYTFYGKLYSFKAWKNGELIRNLVPCKRKSDGEVGVYDLVTKTFFTNAGTGEFICDK